MRFLLGLTGNIACGKSTVGAILAERFGADYVDSDKLVHTLYAPGTRETKAVAAHFGQHLLQADGTIDRRALGDIVMANPEQRKALQEILRPGIRRVIRDRLNASTADVAILDAIRLFEARLNSQCDTVWVVTCERDAQVARLVATRGLSREQAELRVDAQEPQERKSRRANAVIDNRGTLEDLTRQVEAAWAATVAPRLPTAEQRTVRT